MEFHHKVREGYLLLMKLFPERIYKIDASRTIEEVCEESKAKVKQLLEMYR